MGFVKCWFFRRATEISYAYKLRSNRTVTVAIYNSVVTYIQLVERRLHRYKTSISIILPDKKLVCRDIYANQPKEDCGNVEQHSSVAEQEGINANPIELSQFLGFLKSGKQQTEIFAIGPNQYIVTTVHENWFAARCVNTSKPGGEGVIAIQTNAFFLVAQYDGPIGSASRAMAALDHFTWQLSREKSLATSKQI